MIHLLLLLLLILFFLLFFFPYYISILINIISPYHLAEFLILIISALSFLIGITHIVYKYIVNFLQHIFSLFSKIDLNAKTVPSQTYVPSSFGCAYHFDNLWNLFIIVLNLLFPYKNHQGVSTDAHTSGIPKSSINGEPFLFFLLLKKSEAI